MTAPLLRLVLFLVAAAAVVVVSWPRWGLLARLRHGQRASLRVGMEDALKHLYKTTRHGREATLESVAGALEVSQATAARLLGELQRAGLVRPDRTTVLTDEGVTYALRIIRTHRLWERYLADRTGVEPGEWHAQAEQQEHRLTAEAVEALDARLGRPRFDPHGDPIPTAAGELPERRGVPLTHLDVGEAGEISHLEDEPRELFDRLVKQGISPGMRLRVLPRSESGGIRIAADGRTLDLEPAAAENVTVVALEGEGADPFEEWSGLTLADIGPGEEAEVLGLSPACQGSQRRRLLDLGVVPGTIITVDLLSTMGDPTAYMIRGASIALRREQQRWIRIRRSTRAAA